jgi:hypothetical protein
MAKCPEWHISRLTRWLIAIIVPDMDEQNHSHASVIIALGGKAKIADALGLGRNVVTKWHVRGIPAKYWHRVCEIAATKQINITPHDLEAPPARSDAR